MQRFPHVARMVASPSDALAAWRRKNALLGAVVQASELLLGADSMGDVAEAVLRIIGEAMGADRCTLGRMEPPDTHSTAGFITFDFEWSAIGIARQTDNPVLKTLDCDAYPDFMTPLRRGEPVAIKSRDIADPVGRAEMAAICQSQFVYPILVDGELWGLFGADDCHQPRDWSAEEIATFRVVAAAFSSVIKRERMAAQRLDAERCRAETAAAFNRELGRRNDLLNVVVEASEFLLKAQSLDEVMPTILARIGTVMAADRCCLGQCSTPDAKSRTGYCTFTHEWTAPGVARQTDDPALKIFNFDQYQEFHRPLLRGEPIGVKTPEIADHVARSEQESTGAQSQFVFPITVDGVLWGCFCADDCQGPRDWSQEEIATLRVVASALASVIKRERLTELRMAAERRRIEELASSEAKAAHDRETAIFKERARFAGQIHDTLAQGFTGVLLHLEALRVRAEQGETVQAPEIQAIRNIAALGLAEARRSALALRPLALDGRGLADALQQLAARSSVPGLLVGRWLLKGTPRNLATDAEDALLNIAHEAVSNAIRHADAHTVEITLSYTATGISLRVSDDGIGFDASDSRRRGHTFGLNSMQERAAAARGKLTVKSRHDHGTTVTIEIRHA